jgi:hypothetical protein
VIQWLKRGAHARIAQITFMEFREHIREHNVSKS